MLRRVELLVPAALGVSSRVWGGTFHHIGNRILRRHAPLVGFQPNYTILDQEDAKSLMEACISDLKLNPKGSRFPRGEVIGNIVGLSVNTHRTIDELVLDRYPFFCDLLDDIRAAGRSATAIRKRELNCMDFDDLLLYWKTLLQKHPEVRGRYGEQFHQVLVDEYQDTNRLQAEIIDLMAEHHGNVMVVGDDSQSIYSFRGANFENILSFPERYPAAKVFKLEINYRSTPEILHLANASIVCNRCQFPKELQTARPTGVMPCLVPAQDVLEQADFVVRRIAEIRERGHPPVPRRRPVPGPLPLHGTADGADPAGNPFRGEVRAALLRAGSYKGRVRVLEGDLQPAGRTGLEAGAPALPESGESHRGKNMEADFIRRPPPGL